jgi:hypothetical protein
MAYFDLIDENPDDDKLVCTEACHEDQTPNNDTTPDTPGDKYDLKYEAAHAVNIGSHEDLPDVATYNDCLECHTAGTDMSLRQQLHQVHMAHDSHYEEGCFGCHVVEGYGPDSPSGQILESGE